MSEFKTLQVDERPFEPTEWLAEEILWGIVKEPFPDRWKRWISADQTTHESAIVFSNWDRARLDVERVEAGDEEFVPKAAWDLGKLAAGLCSYVVQFEARPENWGEPPEAFAPGIISATEKVLEQTKIGMRPRFSITSDSDARMLENRLSLVSGIARTRIGEYPRFPEHAFLLIDMTGSAVHLATSTTNEWLKFIGAHDGEFEMIPGGTPRSSGEKIDKKLEIFRTIPRVWQN